VFGVFAFAESKRKEIGNMSGILFKDTFEVKDTDPEGKKFDRGNISFVRVITENLSWAKQHESIVGFSYICFYPPAIYFLNFFLMSVRNKFVLKELYK